MPYGVITNKLNECSGMLGAQGVVSYLVDENNYYILQTDQITECIGIGILIYSNEQKLKQISLLHSLSEHRFPDNKKEASARLTKYLTKTFQDREQLLKNSLTYERMNGLYFSCSLVQMLSALDNQGHIIIKLQLGSNNSEQSTIKSGLKGLRKWLNTYQELTNLNFTFDIQLFENQGCYFSIDSQGNAFTSRLDYQNHLLLYKLENKLKNNHFKTNFYPPNIMININNQIYQAPETIFNTYQIFKQKIEAHSVDNKIRQKGQKLLKDEDVGFFHTSMIFHRNKKQSKNPSTTLNLN